MNEEERLQQQIECGEKQESPDALAYMKVFDALKRDPESILPTYFADNVVGIIEARSRVQFTLLEKIGFAFAILVLIILLASSILITGFSVDWGFLRGLGPYSPVLAFGVAMLFFFHILDKRLIQHQVNNRA